MKKILLLILLLPGFIFSQEKTEEKEDKNANFTFIPILSYNKSFGTQLGFMSSVFFDMDRRDSISPISSAGLFGSYFTNKTLFLSIYSKLYFKEDKYRTTFGVGYGDVKFQTYVNIPDIPIPEFNYPGGFLDYNTTMTFYYSEILFNVYNDIFIGPRASYSTVETIFDSEYIPNELNSLLGIGIGAEYDSRDKIMNPHTGQNVKIKTFSFLEALGSTSEYHKVKIEYNKYFKLNKKAVIMGRAFSVISFGDVPFSGENVVGRDDLRGYSQGKYRGNQVYALQSEFRWNFYKKWGMVAFGGIATSIDDWGGANYSGVLPAIGTGIRFKAIPSRNINIGIDVAAGKDDWGLYFRIGEAFGR